MMNKQGRPTMGAAVPHAELATISGHRGLDQALNLFRASALLELSDDDFPEPEPPAWAVDPAPAGDPAPAVDPPGAPGADVDGDGEPELPSEP